MEGGSGGQAGFFLEIGSYFVKASLARRFASQALAYESERPLEELRQSLGIYHPSRIWFLCRGVDEAIWAVSVTRKLSTLREQFNGASGATVDSVWRRYLDGFRLTLDLGRQANVLLDCNPNNFGVEGDRLWYVDDELMGERSTLLGLQALLRLREYEDHDHQFRHRFLVDFLDLVSGCSAAERRRWGLTHEAMGDLVGLRDAKLQETLDDFFSAQP